MIIPVYKTFDNLTVSEKRSFNQALKVFANEDIILALPEKLNIKNYDELSMFNNNKKLGRAEFSEMYFEGIEGYNRLLLSCEFYESLSDYEYVLIFQLDAWVFSNALDYWCSKEFFFIGAPVFKNYDENKNLQLEKGTLNGGLSLRAIQPALKILKLFFAATSVFNKVCKVVGSKKIATVVASGICRFKFREIKNTDYLRAMWQYGWPNEDIVWTKYFPSIFKNIKLPKVEEAMSFAFDMHPDFLYKLNGSQLPMACHAWEKYKPVFWSKFIKD